MSVIDRINQSMDSLYLGVWRWLFALNREEWILTLAIGSILGFLCMRGYGSRSH